MNSKAYYFKLVKKFKKPLIIVSILSLFASACTVGFAYASKYLLDSIDLPIFYTYLCILVGLVLLEIIFKIFNSYLQNKNYAKIQIQIKKDFYLGLLNTDSSSLQVYRESDLLTRLTNDTKIVSSGVMSIIPEVVLMGSRIVFALAVLFVLDWMFGLILLVSGIVIFIFTMLLRRYNKKLQKNIQEAEGQTLGFYQEGIRNLDVLKIFNNKRQVEEKLHEVNQNYYSANMKKYNFNLGVNSGFLFVMRGSYLFAIIWCAFRFNQGVTFGSLLAIVQLISQITIPFTNLSGVLPTYYSCLASIDRIYEIENLAKEEEKQTVEFKSLDVKDLSYSYDREVVIEPSSFQIKKNEFTLIKAGSGKGKTTLIKLLMGLYKPTKGKILINNKIPSTSVKDLYAYLPQTNLMMSGTIKENLLFFADKTSDEKIQDALKFACIKEDIDAFPEGVNTYLYDFGAGLSEGQLQRVAIARVILADKQVIVLDEATSALDAKLEEQVLINLKRLNKTIIFISHKKMTSTFADRILTIEDGVVTNAK